MNSIEEYCTGCARFNIKKINTLIHGLKFFIKAQVFCPVINTGDKAGVQERLDIAMDCYSQAVEPICGRRNMRT